jgi:hypothetical protein
MKKFKVGFDIDDVFLHTYQAMHVIAEKAGITNGVTPTSWNPYEQYGCTRDEWVEVIAEANRQGWLYRDVVPDQDALRAVRELAWDGHEIHLVTARGFFGDKEITEEHTEGWLVEYAVPHHSLTYSQAKGYTAVNLGLDYFIDDHVRNWQDVALTGVQSYLLDRPWNKDVGAGKLRVQSVQQYVDIIKEAASE